MIPEAPIEIDAPAREGEARTFLYRDAYGLPSDGFAIRHRGRLFVYQNQCPHQPLSLDYGDGQFMDESGDFLLCRNHGAVFDPATGECLGGPCPGAFLRALSWAETPEGRIRIEIPDATEPLLD